MLIDQRADLLIRQAVEDQELDIAHQVIADTLGRPAVQVAHLLQLAIDHHAAHRHAARLHMRGQVLTIQRPTDEATAEPFDLTSGVHALFPVDGE